MKNNEEFDEYHIVECVEKTELQHFASWFHQDWETVFPDFHSGARIYLDGMPLERRRKLRVELKQFIQTVKSPDTNQARNAWFELGAQAWQPDLDVLDTLNEFVEMSTD